MGVPSNMHSVGIWPFDDLIQAGVQKYAKSQAPVGTSKKITDQVKAAYNKQQKQAADNDTFMQPIYAMATNVLNMLLKRGIRQPGASYGVYQTYFETGAYKNAGALKYNNLSGIMYAGQKGAKKGPNGYAVFDNLDRWADAYAHELTKKSNPAGAGTLEDFNKRLVANKYYSANPSDYLSGLKRARLVLKVIPAADRAGYDPANGTTQDKGDLDIPGSTDYSKKSGKWIKDHPMATGVLAALGIFIGIRAIAK